MYSLKVIEKNNNSKLYQWNTDVYVKVCAPDGMEIHHVDFSHNINGPAIRRSVNVEGGIVKAKVPNKLLQSPNNIRVWFVSNGQTVYGDILVVAPKAKNPEYILPEDEDEVYCYTSLEKRIAELEKQGAGAGISEEQLKRLFAEVMPKELPASDVYEWAKQPNKPSYTAEEVGALSDKTKIPSKTSELTNDNEFVTKVAADLQNYYLKSETYTRKEVKQLISAIPKFAIQPVVTLPTNDISQTTVYLLKTGEETENLYTEYIHVNGIWECLGTQKVNLTGYALKEEIPKSADDVGAAGKKEFDDLSQNVSKLSREIDGKQPKGNYLTSIPSEYITEDELEEEINMLKAQGVQQVPLIANSVEECTDKTKVYVLKPDYYAYVYGKHTKEVETTVTVPAKASVIVGKRYSFSGGTFQEKSGCSAVIIPIDPTADSCTIEMQTMTRSAYTNVYVGLTADSYAVEVSGTWNEALTSCTLGSVQAIQYNQYKYLVFTASSTAVEGEYNNSKLFYNGKEVELVVTTDPTKAMHESTTTTTQTVTEEGFYNTGCSLFSVDFEKRIIALEKEVSKVNADINLVEFLNSVHCPIQLSANSETDSDFNLHTFADFGSGFHSYFDDLVARYPHYLVREHLGKDSSGTIDMYRYVLGKHYWSAWYKENYPRMYAWKNGNIVIYSVSISPRINENMYSTTYIGTVYSKVTSINATNRSRTVNGLEFVRYEDGDVEPTVYYTSSYNRFSHLVDINENWENKIASIEGNMLTGYENKPLRYIRYPFGDLTKDKKPLIHMTIIANEHGGDTEPAIPSLIVARLIRDLCNGQCSSNNPIYRFLRDNVQITFIPAVNPHGLNKYASGEFDGYYNGNGVNINRNYDTVGWDYCYNNQSVDGNDKLGAYAGSENETQYVMNTMVDSKSVVAMSVHTISCLTKAQTTRCMYQGQNPNGEYTQLKIDEIADDMKSSYNLDFIAYDPLECPPSTTAKSPSFITQIGAYGGIVEMQCHNPLATEEEITLQTTMFTDVVMEQNYSLLLKFITMWLSDYLESK